MDDLHGEPRARWRAARPARTAASCGGAGESRSSDARPAPGSREVGGCSSTLGRFTVEGRGTCSTTGGAAAGITAATMRAGMGNLASRCSTAMSSAVFRLAGTSPAAAALRSDSIAASGAISPSLSRRTTLRGPRLDEGLLRGRRQRKRVLAQENGDVGLLRLEHVGKALDGGGGGLAVLAVRALEVHPLRLVPATDDEPDPLEARLPGPVPFHVADRRGADALLRELGLLEEIEDDRLGHLGPGIRRTGRAGLLFDERIELSPDDVVRWRRCGRDEGIPLRGPAREEGCEKNFTTARAVRS